MALVLIATGCGNKTPLIATAVLNAPEQNTGALPAGPPTARNSTSPPPMVSSQPNPTSTPTPTPTTTASPQQTASPTPPIKTPGPATILSFAANPQSITQGERTALVWHAINVNKCIVTADTGQGEYKPIDGVLVLPSVPPNTNITQTVSYSITCIGDAGSATAQVFVTVTPPSQTNTGNSNGQGNSTSSAPSGNGTPPTVSFSANPPNLKKDETLSLVWVATNADFCILSGGYNGWYRPIDTISFSVRKTESYGVTCIGSGGYTTSTITVPVV